MLLSSEQSHFQLSSLRNDPIVQNTSFSFPPNTMINQYIPHNVRTILSLDGKQIGDDGVKELAKGIQYNTIVKVLYLWANNIGDLGATALGNCLSYNTTLKMLQLCENNIGNEGAKGLAKGLMSNTTLVELYLEENDISDEGAIALAKGLHTNQTLVTLALHSNKIGNKGAKALACGIRCNSSLRVMNLEVNHIGNEGARALAEALKINVSLYSLSLQDNYIDNAAITGKINVMTYWNDVGAISPKNIVNLSLDCQERFLNIPMFLKTLPICDDLHWPIIGMLKVEDIVVYGNPTWCSITMAEGNTICT